MGKGRAAHGQHWGVHAATCAASRAFAHRADAGNVRAYPPRAGRPGDRVSFRNNANPDFIAQARTNFGLDKPLPVQYAIYLSRLVRGDFGTSYSFGGKPVLALIGDRVGASLVSATRRPRHCALIAIPVGILSATRQYSAVDNVTTVGSFVGLAVPNFWLALLLQLYLGVQFRLLPTISTDQATRALSRAHQVLRASRDRARTCRRLRSLPASCARRCSK